MRHKSINAVYPNLREVKVYRKNYYDTVKE